MKDLRAIVNINDTDLIMISISLMFYYPETFTIITVAHEKRQYKNRNIKTNSLLPTSQITSYHS